MPKKILIVASIIFIIALGFGAYLYFFKIKPSNVANTSVTTTTNNTNPFGTAGSANVTNSDRIVNADGSISIPVIALTHLYTDPVAGATIVSEDGDEHARILDRGTGHVYDFNLSSGLLTRTTNTTIPKIQEALWSPSGKNVILRYLGDDNQTITTYSAKLLLPTGTSTDILGSLQGSFLPDNINSLALNPAGTKTTYVASGDNGASIISSNLDGTKASTLYTSALIHWNISWPESSTIALTSSPSSQTPGYLYFLSTSGSLHRILGNINGLTTLVNPTATEVLYSDSLNTLSLYTIKTARTSVLPVSTFAEKCVWSLKEKNILYCAVPTSIVDGNSPDSWYQGTVSYNDVIYKINTTSNTASIIADIPTTFNQNIDVINPVLSPNEDFLLFINKHDLSLWALNISNS